jgi:hypothetical protein
MVIILPDEDCATSFQVSLKDLSHRLGFGLNGATTGNRGSDRRRHNHHQCSAFGPTAVELCASSGLKVYDDREVCASTSD